MPREELKDQEPQKTEEQTLQLAKETLKDLDADSDAEQVKGGAMQRSFSCVRDVCGTQQC